MCCHQVMDGVNGMDGAGGESRSGPGRARDRRTTGPPLPNPPAQVAFSPPEHAAPGSGVCAPWTYLLRNCWTLGSDALETVS
ncbi:hypothetical protein SALBM311S_07632 [Streptomyces alboniger]